MEWNLAERKEVVCAPALQSGPVEGTTLQRSGLAGIDSAIDPRFVKDKSKIRLTSFMLRMINSCTR
jgi:hypothetical protein